MTASIPSNRTVKICSTIRLQVVPNARNYGLLRLRPILLQSSLKQRRQLKASNFFRLPIFSSNFLAQFQSSTPKFLCSFRFSQTRLKNQKIVCCCISLISILIQRSRESGSYFSMEEQQKKTAKDQELNEDHEENEAIELVLFQVPECYVYLVSKLCPMLLIGIEVFSSQFSC